MAVTLNDTLSFPELDGLALDIEQASKRHGSPFQDDPADVEGVLRELDKIALEAGDNPRSAPEVNKSVKPRYRASAFRDAKFIRDFKAHSRIEPARKTGDFLVICTSPSTPHPRASHMRPWWELYQARSARRHRTPPLWREASDYLRAEYYHLAIKTLGAPFGFTLDLHPDTEAQARRQDEPLDWLCRRLSRRIKAACGRSLSFWAVVEETDDRRLHLHGEIALPQNCTPRELAHIRKAFRLAGDEWELNRQRQVKLSPSPNFGWVSYCLKNFWRGSPGVRKLMEITGSPWRLTFQGSLLFATRDVNARAAELFSGDSRLLTGRQTPQ